MKTVTLKLRLGDVAWLRTTLEYAQTSGDSISNNSIRILRKIRRVLAKHEE